MQAIPGTQEQLANRIDTGLGLARQRDEQLVAARQQEIEELAAHLPIVAGDAEVLDDEDEESIPTLERRLPSLELLGTEGSLRRRNGRRLRRHVDGDLDPHPALLRRDRAWTQRAERGHDRLRSLGCYRRADEGARFVDGWGEIEMEGFEPFLDPALDDLPEAARDDGAVLPVVEVRVEVAEAELPVAADFRRREAVEVSVPREGCKAEAKETEAHACAAASHDAGALLRRVDGDVAQNERAAAGCRAPEHDIAGLVGGQRLAKRSAEQGVVDGEREAHLGGARGREPEDRRQQDGEAAHRSARQNTKARPPPAGGAGLSKQDPAASYSPTRRPCSTIGAGGLNGRVRDGNGCFPSAITTGRRCDTLDGIPMSEQARGSSPQADLMVKPHGHLVPVSSTPYGASTPGLSTSSSSRGLQGPCGPGMPYLGVGFPLICFQRLSRPHIATRRCGWRHNRITSGASIPVLSY